MLQVITKRCDVRFFVPVLFCVITSGISTPAQADIAADAWLLRTRADLDLEEGFFSDQVTELADSDEGPAPVMPFNLTHTATAVETLQVGTSTYGFSTTGDSGLFGFSFDHTASAVFGPFDSSLTGSDGFLTFTPDTDVAFSLTGNYTLTGNGIIHLGLSLTDENGNDVFASSQETDNIANQSFVVGVNDGLLEGGTQYTLAYDFHVGGLDLGNVTGAGGFDLQLGVQVIPVPGAAALGLLGLGMVAWFGRRFG